MSKSIIKKGTAFIASITVTIGSVPFSFADSYEGIYEYASSLKDQPACTDKTDRDDCLSEMEKAITENNSLNYVKTMDKFGEILSGDTMKLKLLDNRKFVRAVRSAYEKTGLYAYEKSSSKNNIFDEDNNSYDYFFQYALDTLKSAKMSEAYEASSISSMFSDFDYSSGGIVEIYELSSLLGKTTYFDGVDLFFEDDKTNYTFDNDDSGLKIIFGKKEEPKSGTYVLVETDGKTLKKVTAKTKFRIPALSAKTIELLTTTFKSDSDNSEEKMNFVNGKFLEITKELYVGPEITL